MLCREDSIYSGRDLPVSDFVNLFEPEHRWLRRREYNLNIISIHLSLLDRYTFSVCINGMHYIGTYVRIALCVLAADARKYFLDGSRYFFVVLDHNYRYFLDNLHKLFINYSLAMCYFEYFWCIGKPSILWGFRNSIVFAWRSDHYPYISTHKLLRL